VTVSGPTNGARNSAQDFDSAASSLAVRNLRGISQSPQNKEKAKIEKSAQDFESILVGQWLEQAQKSFATVPGDDPDKENQDPGQDQLRSIALHSLAEGFTKAGGFGLARMISERLEATEGLRGTAQSSDPKTDKSLSVK
jgi:Rod binding domain-containing protein